MVRLYVSNNSIEIPMDFEPEKQEKSLTKFYLQPKLLLNLKIQVGVNLIAIRKIWIAEDLRRNAASRPNL